MAKGTTRKHIVGLYPAETGTGAPARCAQTPSETRNNQIIKLKG